MSIRQFTASLLHLCSEHLRLLHCYLYKMSSFSASTALLLGEIIAKRFIGVIFKSNFTHLCWAFICVIEDVAYTLSRLLPSQSFPNSSYCLFPPSPTTDRTWTLLLGYLYPEWRHSVDTVEYFRLLPEEESHLVLGGGSLGPTHLTPHLHDDVCLLPILQ
jgi:hypothetical protein